MSYADAVRGVTQAGQAQGHVKRSIFRVVDDNDVVFENMMKDFHQKFHIRQDSMELVTAKVVQICNETLGLADIRHTTISSRIKTWTSADGSIRRKRHERELRRQLRIALESPELDWDKYCDHVRLKPTITESFKSADEMLDQLHDFGGIRISLYFPGDVERISRIFKEKFKVESETRKHQSMDVIMDLQRRLDDLDPDASAHKACPSHTERTFPGYKATHFCVRLLDTDIPSNKKAVWNDLSVEIQVGTIVMHAWSEIEHDMIYKPLESQTISEDEVRLLDLINGIVATGESALRQLEASTAKRRNERANDEKACATSHHELGHWLEKYWVEANHVKIEGDWEYLYQLYLIVKANGDHQLGKIRRVLETINSKEIVHRSILPIKMLEAGCRPLASFEEPQFQGEITDTIKNKARFWATQFIHSLNMAMFFGVAEAFVQVKPGPPRPNVVDILDLIHPFSPRCKDSDTAIAIARYCKRILDYHQKQLYDEKYESQLHRTPPRKQLLHTVACLPCTNHVAISLGVGEEVFIPAEMVGLIATSSSARKLGSDTPTTALQVTQKLSFIEYYVKYRQSDVYDGLEIWDRLKLTMSGNPDIDMKKWFLVPTLNTYGSDAAWNFVERPLQLDAAKFESNVTSRIPFAGGMEADTDEILRLAYRLHPEHHDLVDLAWNMLKPLSSKIDISLSRKRSIYRASVQDHRSAPMMFEIGYSSGNESFDTSEDNEYPSDSSDL